MELGVQERSLFPPTFNGTLAKFHWDKKKNQKGSLEGHWWTMFFPWTRTPSWLLYPPPGNWGIGSSLASPTTLTTLTWPPKAAAPTSFLAIIAYNLIRHKDFPCWRHFLYLLYVKANERSIWKHLKCVKTKFNRCLNPCICLKYFFSYIVSYSYQKLSLFSLGMRHRLGCLFCLASFFGYQKELGNWKIIFGYFWYSQRMHQPVTP
jgi:hypothetical protein